MSVHVGIYGASGAVGREFIHLLAERKFPLDSLRLFGSARSAGTVIEFNGKALVVEELTPSSFEGIDLAFFSMGGGPSKEYAPLARAAGALVIDNSSAFRNDDDVPLVVPEVNGSAALHHQGIIANPNCSTIQMVVALEPLHKAAGLRRVVVSTYQAVSGSGQAALDELEAQATAHVQGSEMPVEQYPVQIAFNLIPHIDGFMDNGYTREEMKMVVETRKIMNLPELPVSATCVRVPVARAHSESIQIETVNKLSAAEARALLAAAPGIVVKDEREPGGYPTPLEVAYSQETWVGRIREDISSENGLAFWVVADQLYKGAALNAIQIAEYLYENSRL